MRKPKITTQIIPKLKSFTLDSVTKYTKGKEKNLVEQLFYFPNFGQGFKVFMRMRPYEYWVVDNVTVKNNRHGKIFGMYFDKDVMENKIAKIRRTLQEGRWGFEFPNDKVYSENGVEYNIKETQDLIAEKSQILVKRNQSIGHVPKQILEREQKKKAKLEASTKKKK